MNCKNCQNLKPFGIIKVTDDMKCIKCDRSFKFDKISDLENKIKILRENILRQEKELDYFHKLMQEELDKECTIDLK